MTYQQAKADGVVIAEKKGCELIQVQDGKTYRYWMHSPKTGDHDIPVLKPMIEDPKVAERVYTHWNGFLAVQ